jgi:uncharacterized protein YecT (DUF1311 family)
MTKILVATAYLLIGVSGTPALSAQECGNLKSAFEQNDCAKTNFEDADAQMKAAYQKVVSTLGKTAQTGGKGRQLQTGQREWVKKRDESCAAEAKENTGPNSQPLDNPFAKLIDRELRHTSGFWGRTKVE